MSASHTQDEYVQDVSLYFGIVGTFFIIPPLFITAFRLVFRSHVEGLSAMFTPPVTLSHTAVSTAHAVGRAASVDRPLSSRLRAFLFQRSSYGFYLDVSQAVASLFSCLFFIVVSYLPSEPIWVTDIEDVFTVYFIGDYMLRLWIAQDSLAWYFSLVSLLDFITVVPAITSWLIAAGGTYDVNVAAVMNAIRVFRVMRMFRVVRVVRMINVGTSSFAFQRQVFVLVATVLSMVFVAAGLYQVSELASDSKLKFHAAVYYATATVVGRPAVPLKDMNSLTPVILTAIVMLAATIIPTFVAELIRIWYDAATLETFHGNAEMPHVIVCGDTNVSRLRALANQYFNKARDPESCTTLVIMAEAKPEGALRSFIDTYKHSGNVRYVRGSARRAADLRRAGIDTAKCVIVLNYRADKDAASADTEVLSTVMAVKNVSASMRVLAQLHRPRKRNHLKAVPGWQDGDKSISAVSLSMTLLGITTRLPGFATFMVNLIRRGTTLAGLPDRSLTGQALPWWHIMLYGEVAKPAVRAVLAGHIGPDGKRLPPTPLEEYAMSVEQSIFEMPVTPLLVGRTFGAVARMAYLRYRITCIGATVPLNADLDQLVPGLPRTYKTHIFPVDTILSTGMKIFVIAAGDDVVERFRVATGGETQSVLSQALEIAGSAFQVGHGAHAAVLADSNVREADVTGQEALADAEAAGGASGWFAAHTAPAPGVAEVYRHNASGVLDLNVPWCFHELEEIDAAERAFIHKLHLDAAAQQLNAALPIPVFNRFGQRSTEAHECPACGKPTTSPMSLDILHGHGIAVAGGDVHMPDHGAPAAPVDAHTGASHHKNAADDFAESVFGPDPTPAPAPALHVAPSAASHEHDNSPLTNEAAATVDTSTVSVPTPVVSAIVAHTELEDVRPRTRSIGDDGLGGNDDTDDIVGVNGPLHTIPPSLGVGGIGATARAAARATVNSLAVRLALPSTAVTDVEALAADALGGTHTYRAHVLVCGVNDALGYLIRAVASMIGSGGRAAAGTVSDTPASAVTATGDVEGAQYSFRPDEIVILAPAKPADAAMNALYPGSSALLSRCTFLTGNPSEAQDLIRAGVMSARAAVVLNGSKASSSADGSDNLSDDTDAIVTTATIVKLNPALYVITELLHGTHAPFVKPTGATLNDAQRGAFIYILEEREANRQRAKLDAAIRRLSAENEIRSAGSTAITTVDANDEASMAAWKTRVLLLKLQKQQARLRAMMAGSAFGLGFVRALDPASTTSAASSRSPAIMRAPSSEAMGAGAAGGALANAAAQLDSTGGGGVGDADLDVMTDSGLSASAIVDVIVGVREEFGASAAANDGASFSMGAGASGAGGSSKGSGATNDLFGTPAWAAGRVFTGNTLDSVVLETFFSSCVVGVTKQLLRAARKQRMLALPMTEALTLAQLSIMAAGGPSAGHDMSTYGVVARTRAAYLAGLSRRVTAARTGGPRDAADAPPVDNYGQLYDHLIRTWRLLPLGMYRRVHPAKGLRVSAATVAALQFAAGPPTPGDAFIINRALVSYVFANPPPNTPLGEHDLVYVLLPEEAEIGAGFASAGPHGAAAV